LDRAGADELEAVCKVLLRTADGWSRWVLPAAWTKKPEPFTAQRQDVELASVQSAVVVAAEEDEVLEAGRAAT